MKLLCNRCGNYTYFQADIEYLRELEIKNGLLEISDTVFDNWNYTDSSFRDNLIDIVQFVCKSGYDALLWNNENESFKNKYITCASCESREVTTPYKREKKHQSLEEEIISNQPEYKQLLNTRQKARKPNGHYLPVVWKPT